MGMLDPNLNPNPNPNPQQAEVGCIFQRCKWQTIIALCWAICVDTAALWLTAGTSKINGGWSGWLQKAL